MLIKRFSSKILTNSYYWQHFGLLRNPFGELIDENEAYISPSWELRLDLIQSAIQQENAILGVIAKKGSGKTTFSSILLNQLNDVYEAYRVQAQASTTLEAWAAILYDTFSVPHTPTDAIESQLDEWIAEIQHRPKACVLLVDDAGLWPDECLDALIYLIKQQSLNQMRFHCILLGDIELQAKLAKIAKDDLNRDFIRTLEFEPFSAEEARQYLLHRLILAGLKEPMPIIDNAFERIYEMSQGQPEEMNQEAQQWMVNEIDRQSAMVEPTFWQTYQTHLIGAGVIAAIALVISILFIRSPNPSKPKAQAAAPSLNFAVAQQPLLTAQNTATNTINSNANTVAVNNMALKNNNLNAPVVTPIVPSSASDISGNSVNSSASNLNTPAGNSSLTGNAVSPSTPNLNNSLVKNSPENPSMLSGNDSNNLSTATPSPEGTAGTNFAANTSENSYSAVSNSAPSNASEIKDAKPLAPALALAPENSKAYSSEKASSIKRVKVSHKSKTLEKNKAAKFKNEAFTATRKSGKYTLQLAALNSPEAANKAIKQYRLVGKAHYVKRRVNGKTYFVVILGNYATEADAKRVQNGLPASIRHAVWLRKKSAE